MPARVCAPTLRAMKEVKRERSASRLTTTLDRSISRSIFNPMRGFDDSAADRHRDFHGFDVEREERRDLALELDDPGSGRAIAMAVHGQRPGVQRAYGLRPETGSQTLAEKIRRTAVAKVARWACRAGGDQVTMRAKRSTPWTSAKPSLSSKR